MTKEKLTRIICVGPRRLYEAMATLSFDYKISTPIDQTVIFTPYDKSIVEHALKEFSVNYENFVILNDEFFNDKYDITRWSHDNWYKQQAFKLCALDYFDSEKFLIQDADLLITKNYDVFIGNKPVFKAESLWNDYHMLYAKGIEEIIGYRRKIDVSLVNEFMPYLKSDWVKLKTFIEHKYNKSWLDAIPDIRPFDNTKWFSEYELLGIWKTNQDDYNWNIWVSQPSQPPINTWDDFYNINWNLHSAVKFHVQPLKFMTAEEAHKVVKHIYDTVN